MGKYKTRQDKTGNTGRLGALLIHQLVLVYWRVVPQTISFYNPEPSYTRSSLMAYAKRCRDVAALLKRGCIAEILRCGCTVRMPRCGCIVETPRHGNIVETNLSYFCVVGSKPWHYPLLKRHIPDGIGLLRYRWWNRLIKSWAWTRFLAGSQVVSEGGQPRQKIKYMSFPRVFLESRTSWTLNSFWPSISTGAGGSWWRFEIWVSW